MRVYKSNNYPNRWYAHSASIGWVMFLVKPVNVLVCQARSGCEREGPGPMPS